MMLRSSDFIAAGAKSANEQPRIESRIQQWKEARRIHGSVEAVDEEDVGKPSNPTTLNNNNNDKTRILCRLFAVDRRRRQPTQMVGGLTKTFTSSRVLLRYVRHLFGGFLTLCYTYLSMQLKYILVLIQYIRMHTYKKSTFRWRNTDINLCLPVILDISFWCLKLNDFLYFFFKLN